MNKDNIRPRKMLKINVGCKFLRSEMNKDNIRLWKTVKEMSDVSFTFGNEYR